MSDGFAPIKGWEKGVGNWRKRECVQSLHDVQFPYARNGLRPALYLELAVDRVDIPFHRTHRNHEPVRNFTIGVARDDQAQHLQLTFAQRFTRRICSRPRYSYSRGQHILVLRSAQQCQEVFSIVRGARLFTERTTAQLHQQLRYWWPFIYKEADVTFWFGK